MDCPKCKSTSHVKNGHVGGRQRHLCKDCKYSYTIEYRGKPPETKKMALKMYLEGIGFRSIGRLLNVSHVSVFQWIKKFGKQAAETVELVPESPIIEMDELHTYVGEKKTTNGSGSHLTGSGK